jgi:glycerol-3-phosphate O-acyltransferase
MVSYDRVFEVRNLTKSMVTLKEGSFASSLASSVKRMQQFNKDQLGCVFVKYLEPIYLKEYMQTIEQTEPKADPAFKLTQELYLRQQEATPVTLNSLIAAVLLYEPDEKLAMSDLLARTKTIYQYVKIKQHTITMMQVHP